MALRRRKGQGKTLVDAKGRRLRQFPAGVDGAGAINRDRFETLFGLNHETLRSGGDDLLDANGDIGRLIVEAGGGLRAMVRRLEAIDDEAGKLFARTRNQSKKFYEALSRYETAEKAARAHLLSRDTYEDARKDADEAKIAADALRAERETLRATIYSWSAFSVSAPLATARSARWRNRELCRDSGLSGGVFDAGPRRD